MIFGVASVSTAFTMIASTFCAIMFWTWLNCLPTSLPPSSICTVAPSFFAESAMLLRRMVRNVSSNDAIVTPIFSACASGAARIAAAATAISLVFMINLSPHLRGAEDGALRAAGPSPIGSDRD
ncbi:hypothetical protein BURCENK562V_C1822 [Burkholderia cenocepacia K56-2Valvano]|nr:hypothetical protein BURCENK562V_C1822 [Burkholderia cenocepacia K56-2Valvano]